MASDPWNELTYWLENKNIVAKINAANFEEWGKGLVKTPVVIIEYEDCAVAIDVLPLSCDDPKYLDVEIFGFKNGVIDPTTEMFGMSAQKDWTNHHYPETVPSAGFKYPHYAVLVGRKQSD